MKHKSFVTNAASGPRLALLKRKLMRTGRRRTTTMLETMEAPRRMKMTTMGMKRLVKKLTTGKRGRKMMKMAMVEATVRAAIEGAAKGVRFRAQVAKASTSL